MIEETKKTSLSYQRLLLLLVLYFVGFTMILPDLLKKITLFLDPYAVVINIPILLVSYLVITLLAIYIALPVWKSSIQNFFAHKKEGITMIFISIVAILCINFALSAIISILTQTSNSQNQEVVIENVKISPLYSFFYTCMIAPILEETIFRAGVFTFIRKYGGYIPALLISSFLFGFIHVMNSFTLGNFSDLAYLLVYAGVGLILGIAYEKSDSVLVSIGIHAGNNLFAFLLMLI